MNGTEQKCGNCLFWYQASKLKTYTKTPHGDCHRYPPIAMTTSDDNGDPDSHVSFPETWEYQWCGEWKAEE